MSAQLVQANAVVAATKLNPSVFNQVWLTQHAIIPAPSDDVPTGSMFTDFMVQALTPEFTLVVLPQQLTFAPRSPTAPGSQAKDTLGRIVTLLEHVPYIAVGLNFMWHSEPIADLGRFGRKLFANAGAPFDQFSADDARFGTYVSKEVEGARLRLEIRPIRVAEAPNEERLQFAFNFERLLGEDPTPTRPKSIIDTIARWDLYRDSAAPIVTATLERAFP